MVGSRNVDIFEPERQKYFSSLFMIVVLLQVVIIDEVVMTTSDDKGGMGPPQACLAHDYDMMKPVVLATWKHGFQGACPDKSAILAESQVNILVVNVILKGRIV